MNKWKNQNIKTGLFIMNIKIKKALIFLLLPIFYACNQNIKDVELIVFDYSSKMSLFQYDRINSISLIPLQTDEHYLIGDMPELRLADDNLFIMHSVGDTPLRIDRFNMRGEYLNRIGREGRGPGELVSSLISCWSLYGSEMIGVHSYGSNRILLFDFAGEYVSEIHFQPDAFMVCGHDSNIWALMPPETNAPRLICLSENGEEIKSMLNSEKTYFPGAYLWRPFYQTNDKLYIGMPYENTIYVAEQDSVRPAFFIDAGKYAIPHEFYTDPFKVWESIQQNGHAAVLRFMESRDYYVIQVLIRLMEHEEMIWGIKNKEEKEWFWSKREITPCGYEYYIAEISEDNRLLLLINNNSLTEKLPLMQNVLNPQVYESSSDNDNPVLVEIQLK